MDQNQDFEAALEDFRAASEGVILAHYARNDYTFAVPGVTIGKRRGPKYAKLWTTETRDGKTSIGSIHAFVEVATGDIFKPASTKAPAKHARGNIYNEAGRASLTPHGNVHYMR